MVILTAEMCQKARRALKSTIEEFNTIGLQWITMNTKHMRPTW